MSFLQQRVDELEQAVAAGRCFMLTNPKALFVQQTGVELFSLRVLLRPCGGVLSAYVSSEQATQLVCTVKSNGTALYSIPFAIAQGGGTITLPVWSNGGTASIECRALTGSVSIAQNGARLIAWGAVKEI